jgi:hypothetical protein
MRGVAGLVRDRDLALVVLRLGGQHGLGEVVMRRLQQRERLVALAGPEAGLGPLRVRGLDPRILRLQGERLELAVEHPLDDTTVVVDRRGEVDDDAGERVLVRRTSVSQRAIGHLLERACELAAGDEELMQVTLSIGPPRIGHSRSLP